MRPMNFTSMSILLVALLVPCSIAESIDWVTYRGDNSRSGSTNDSLQFPVQSVWTVKAPAVPRLAWSSGEGRVIEGKLLGHRVRFDDAFRTTIAHDRVYYGSTVDHALHCVDLTTGSELWNFVTGGPIRLAPTVSEDFVLFGSDDGVVYCLQHVTGELQWQQRIAPRDEWLLARGEMISKWPIRTGILVHNDVAYYGAGIFPHEDVYLQGRDIKSGKLVWSAGNISAQDAGRNDLSPQGYLLATDDYLVVPSGRSLPAVFSLETGRLLHKRTHSWRSTAGGVVGGTRALLADGQVYTSGPHHFLAMTLEAGDVGFGWFEGRQMCFDDDSAYIATGEYLARLDRLPYAETSRRRHDLEMQIYQLSRSLRSASGDKKSEIERQVADKSREYRQLQDEGVVWEAKCGRGSLAPGDRQPRPAGRRINCQSV